jgi:hypothetical protein
VRAGQMTTTFDAGQSVPRARRVYYRLSYSDRSRDG